MIRNLPDYAKEYTFIVCSEENFEYYFYGAYNDSNKANRIAEEIGGVVFEN
jgi:hypothetical protein